MVLLMDATIKWFLRSRDSRIQTYVTNFIEMGNYGDTNGNKAIPAGDDPTYGLNNNITWLVT